MKTITLNRKYQNYGILKFVLVFDDGQIIPIRNGETKIIKFDKLPRSVQAEQGLMQLKTVAIDDSSTQINLKMNKPLMYWLIVLFPLILMVPMMLRQDYPIFKILSIAGFVTMAIWIIVLFTAKRDEWLTVEVKKG